MLARQILGDQFVDVTWRPFELNADMPAAGCDRRAYRSAKFGSWEHSQDLDAKTVAAGASDGVEFRYDLMTRTPNTLAAHRLAWAARDSGLQDVLVEGLFRAYFTEGKDISDPIALAEITRTAGLGEGFADQALGDERTLRGVRVLEARAESVGLGGVPHFVMRGRPGISGALATDELVRLLQASVTQQGDS